MSRLGDTHLTLLAAAAQRDDGRVLPPPDTIKLRGAALRQVLASLLQRGLVAERPGSPEWRRTDDDRALTLHITDAGLQAIGLGANPAEQAQANEPAREPRGKIAAVLERLRSGASIVDLQAATGWQAHSVRAALTGLRKRGVDVRRERGLDGVAVYWVVSNAA